VDLVAAAQDLVASAAAMDTDAILARFADDAVLEFPYRPGREPRRYEGKGAIAGFLGFARESFSEYTMRADAIHAGDDGRTVVIESSGEGTAAPTGRPYRQRYVIVVGFDDAGRIRSWREYYDPAAVIHAFRP
jgi:ketosteroid isomerase-like protein